MSCSLCHTSFSSEEIKIIYHDKLYCEECHESLLFADDSLEMKKEIKPEKKEKKEVFYKCLKCKSSYSGRNCSCGFKNPLFR